MSTGFKSTSGCVCQESTVSAVIYLFLFLMLIKMKLAARCLQNHYASS